MHIKKLVELLLAAMLILGAGLSVNIVLAEEAEPDSTKEESKEATKKQNDTEETTEASKAEDTEKSTATEKDEASSKKEEEENESDAENKQDSEDSSKKTGKTSDKESSDNPDESEPDESEEASSREHAKDYKNEVKQSESSGDDRNLAVKITETMPFLDVYHNNEIIRIKRIQDKDYKVTNSFARTSRKCPPFCIRPIKLPDNNIETVGELEVLEFLKTKVRNHSGLLIDARLKDWHVKGTIPGSVSIPFTMFTDDVNDINTLQLLELLGAKEDSEGNLDFSEVIDIVLYCNGPWCGQSPRAIKNLLKLGYPSEKMFWYRGGMQAWQSFGLTVITP